MNTIELATKYTLTLSGDDYAEAALARLRVDFAKHALAGLLAGGEKANCPERAVEYADALIERLKR